jgi:hypothetical protein
MAALATAASLAGAAASLTQAQGRGCSSPAGAVECPGGGLRLNPADSDALLLLRASSAGSYNKGLLTGLGTAAGHNSKRDAPAGAMRVSSSVSPAGSTGGPGSAQVQAVAGRSAAAGQTAAPVVPPQKACIGDLLKPFVIYLQVSGRLDSLSDDLQTGKAFGAADT